jgi:hypothetical protein
VEKLKFFDLSIDQKLATISGREVVQNEIVKLRQKKDTVNFDNAGFVEDIEHYDFDPKGIKNTSRWEKVVSTMVYAISGQIPDREEIKRGRQLIERMPRQLKGYVDSSFIINFLPYLLSGFNFQLTDNFIDETNILKDGVTFINDIYQQQSIYSSSLLCAHRESGQVAKMSLVENIHAVKANRALNLQLGLVSNSKTEQINLDWYQQTSTARLSSNMFPEIFINYLKAGNVLNLIKIIQSHEQQMQDLLSSNNTKSIEINLVLLDKLSSEVEVFMEDRFGSDWYKLTGAENNLDCIFKIARDYTLPHIKRLMPFYNQPKDKMEDLEKYRKTNIDKTNDANEKELINSTIDWFINHQKMSGFGKALYETSMYYYWGMMSHKQSKVGIGMDRDYSDYQYTAFKLGYLDGDSDNTAPLLYARRTKNEVPQKILKYISFRQFWRNVD